MKTTERFQVPRHGVKLVDVDPDGHGKLADKAAAESETAKQQERMRELQGLLYADRRHGLLICLQGLDASGKDGTIAHVFASMNAQGVHVTQFKEPTPVELAHDFLWRVHPHAPARGEVGIFNRSHYEDVLVTRVHHLVPKAVWSKRYDRINEFEKNLVDAGTCVLKFYLHISPEEQLRRFAKRLEDPMRQWKISEADYREREYWPEYVEAYEDVFRKTSTEHAPWYVIPANHKWFRNVAVSAIVIEAMESLRLKTPLPSVDLDEIRRKYHAAEKAARTGKGKKK